MNKNTELLNQSGVSIWLDNITRSMLENQTLKKYIDSFSVKGLTSNPTIFDHAISKSDTYDKEIHLYGKSKMSNEEIFIKLAIDDLSNAAQLFKPVFDRSNGLDGMVSLEVSPLLAFDTEKTITAVKELHAQAEIQNLFIKIPGTPEGLKAIEESIFAGIPVNVTLLFSEDQYIAASEAYLRGIERRITAGLNPDVRSVASIFISRWDKATMGKVSRDLQNKLGIAVAQRVFLAYHEFLNSERTQRIMNFGAQPQRLLWASTGTKDPAESDILYIRALVAPYTINTMPEDTLLAFADHGEVRSQLSLDGNDANDVVAAFEKAGIGYDQLAKRLQKEGADSFIKSWNDLLATVDSKRNNS